MKNLMDAKIDAYITLNREQAMKLLELLPGMIVKMPVNIREGK